MSRKGDHIKRVGIVFSGGPAPAANAVISSAAISFLEDDREVIGFFHGYSNLQDYHPVTHRLLPDEHYRIFTERDLRGPAQLARHRDRHRAREPRQGHREAGRPRRPEEDGAAAQRLQRARRSRDRRADLDRRRRHAEDRELPLRVPEAPARRGARASRSSTCRRRSTTTTAASTSRSASSPRST